MFLFFFIRCLGTHRKITYALRDYVQVHVLAVRQSIADVDLEGIEEIQGVTLL